MKNTLIALSISAFLSANAYAAIIIDDFSVGAELRQVGPGNSSNTTFDPGLLGGARDESITVRAVTNAYAASVGFNGNLVFSQGSVDQAYGSLTYDNLGNFDLTGAGTNTHLAMGFRANDIDADIPNVITITAESGANSVTRPLSIPASSLLPLDIYVDFTDFAGVNFAQLDSLTLTFDTQLSPGRDFELDFFSALTPPVPEPSAFVLLALGATSLLVRRRRR